jgi:hypothetical protein
MGLVDVRASWPDTNVKLKKIQENHQLNCNCYLIQEGTTRRESGFDVRKPRANRLACSYRDKPRGEWRAILFPYKQATV